MSDAYLGETCALAAALTWALALVLFKRSGESIPPLSLTLFKNTVGLLLLAVTLLVVGEPWQPIRDLHPHDFYILILSGVVGIAIADSMMFYALNRIGVGLLTITECIYSPCVILFAWWMLSERIDPHDYVGGALVLSGVFVSSTHKPPADRTRAQLVSGMLLGAVAIAMMAVSIVVVKPILEVTPLLSATLIRLVPGTLVLAIPMAVSKKRREMFAVFRPSRMWRYCVPASVLGTYFAMIFWMAGFKYADASVAAILNQTSTAMALVFAAILLGERLTRRKIAAAALAMSGVVVITLA